MDQVIILLVDLVLKNVRIPLEDRIIECGIAIDKGKIHTIAKTSNLPKGSRIMNLKGNIVFPGLIDAHVHLRDLELTYKEDFYTGTCAALAGGFTTILDMPNTKPPTNSVSRLKEKIEIAKKKIVVNVGFFTSYVSGIKELRRLKSSGAFGMKLYPYDQLGKSVLEDTGIFMKTLGANRVVNLPTLIHAESPQIIDRNEKRLEALQDYSAKAYINAHPPEAEIEAVKKICQITKETRSQLHFCHITLNKSLSLIEEARAIGTNITCEVTPHHLLLTRKIVEKERGNAVMNPPLRTFSEVRSLWEGLIAGKIDIISSDHAPHDLIEKKEKMEKKILPGVPGLETTLPLLLTKVNQNKISIFHMVKILAENPAKIFRIRKKGQIIQGFDADFTIINMKKRSKIDSSEFYSKAKYTPFDGFETIGKPIKVFVNGELAMEDGEILLKPGNGRILYS